MPTSPIYVEGKLRKGMFDFYLSLAVVLERLGLPKATRWMAIKAIRSVKIKVGRTGWRRLFLDGEFEVTHK